jgi:hypothetical protein
MGNHEVGRAMGLAAILALKMRTNQTAVALLDEICEPYRGADAEFESEDPNHRGHINPEYASYTDPKGPLGKLIAEAFSPNVDWVTLREDAEKSGDDDKVEKFDNDWYNGAYRQFADRYEFC